MKIVISKNYDEKVLFDSQEFIFEKGKITCLLGESGVGKTTLLRALCGLEKYEGSTDETLTLSVAFQEARLLPFASALDNLKFVGIEDADKWLDFVEIAEKNQLASTLSGGEKQRVSLARAVAKNSELLLLDEPFSSVDTARKVRLLEKLRALLQEEKRTTLFITHDIDEALYAADVLLLLKEGKVTRFEVDEGERIYGDSPLRQQLYEQILRP